MTPEQGKGSDPPPPPNPNPNPFYLRIIIMPGWPCLPCLVDYRNKAAIFRQRCRLLISLPTCDAPHEKKKKEKNRPHGDVAIKVGQNHKNLYYVWPFQMSSFYFLLPKSPPAAYVGAMRAEQRTCNSWLRDKDYWPNWRIENGHIRF